MANKLQRKATLVTGVSTAFTKTYPKLKSTKRHHHRSLSTSSSSSRKKGQQGWTNNSDQKYHLSLISKSKQHEIFSYPYKHVKTACFTIGNARAFSFSSKTTTITSTMKER